MMSQIQEGIYYRSKPKIGNSFCVLSFRAKQNIGAEELGGTIQMLWNMLALLKKGIVKGLEVHTSHTRHGNLTVLIGYGSKIFEIDGIKRLRPEGLEERWQLNPPSHNGGGSIVGDSEIQYGLDITTNDLLDDHFMLQFVADSEYFTNRAAVEVWKELNRLKNERNELPIRISHRYTGFQFSTQRDWLGFHDGVSNLRSNERRHAIAITPHQLKPYDKWLINGTYLAFLRIRINLEKWEHVKVTDQEIIIGRDKLTGCPIIGLDKHFRPIKDSRCPVPGTFEVIDAGNEYFRDHPPYRKERDDSGFSNEILNMSHIGSSRPIDQVSVWDKRSFRIYRQGFGYLDENISTGDFVPGLNFVSFQNTPERLIRVLNYQGKKSADPRIHRLEEFVSVVVGGIFLVPSTFESDAFPGSEIFLATEDRISPHHITLRKE